MLAHTCAHTSIVMYMDLYTSVRHTFLCTTNTSCTWHLPHQLCMWQTMNVSEWCWYKHSHSQTLCVLFNLNVVVHVLYRPLILFQFMYQAFCALGFSCVLLHASIFLLKTSLWASLHVRFPYNWFYVHDIEPSLVILYIHLGMCSYLHCPTGLIFCTCIVFP